MNDRQPAGSGRAFRDKVQAMMRTSILDAAWARAIELPWAQVRIADVADDVGISRQTIYNEFGTKDQLGEAVFARELDKFLVEMEARFRSADRFSESVRIALDWMVEETAGHALLARIVNDARNGSDQSLVALLTVRSEAILLPVRDRLVEMVMLRWPEGDRAAATVVADLMVRLVLGLVVTPTDLDRSAVVDAMVTMAMHVDVRSDGPGGVGVKEGSGK
ncbi:TetR family transcriptional regulator [Nocardioides sp. AE5]|uniref:TetR/AcrR family transcriptional regulator n=1 Tax=Nocardioides sp. AE5 TaxID=2962573 RepID=UPI002882BCAF|nr:TetR family transcriptional regulator [Nocardioides sp. AE5]MDT0200330.1 TetR family transcriptional regulator [Nocardioides sp. AE5]